MNSSFKSWSKTLQASDLTPIVCQILHESKVEVLNWRINPLLGGASVHNGLGLGVYQVTGSARCKGQNVMWTCALKVFGPSDIPEHNLPSHLNYWKRELLAYESGILDHLPGNIVVPRCYAVQELSDGIHCLWFEFIQESDKDWSMEEHYLAARHLGQFNGSYLTGQPLPVRTEWMLSGRTHLVADRQRPDVEKLMSYTKTDLGRWMSHDSINRMDKLWAERQALTAHLNRLPNCFCHHDAQSDAG